MPDPKRLLLADDDPQVRALLDTLCARRFPGVARVVMASADELLHAYAHGGADVIVIDHYMPPGMTGVDVTRLLSSRAVAVPIVMYSSTNDVISPAWAAGVTAFVDKSEPLTTLIATLAALLSA